MSDQEIAIDFDPSLSEKDRRVLSLLRKLRPDYLGQVLYGLQNEQRHGQHVFFEFMDRLNKIFLSIDKASTLSVLTDCHLLLVKLHQDLESLGLGSFLTTALIILGNEQTHVQELRILKDMSSYQERFQCPLLSEIVELFYYTDSEVRGLPSSLQGTLAASEAIATNFGQALNRELNLAYPGSGGHLTPLIMAFDLIERGIIDGANFLLNDIKDIHEFVGKVLKFFVSRGVITELQLSGHEGNSQDHIFTFSYKGKPIRIACNTEDLFSKSDWDPCSRPLNVVYDHLPFQSAPAGSATRFFINEGIISDRLVIHVMPKASIDVDAIAGFRVQKAVRVSDVAFANKNSWTVSGDNGTGLTVALIQH